MNASVASVIKLPSMIARIQSRRSSNPCGGCSAGGTSRRPRRVVLENERRCRMHDEFEPDEMPIVTGMGGSIELANGESGANVTFTMQLAQDRNALSGR
jgi:hypothetical protein